MTFKYVIKIKGATAKTVTLTVRVNKALVSVILFLVRVRFVRLKSSKEIGNFIIFTFLQLTCDNTNLFFDNYWTAFVNTDKLIHCQDQLKRYGPSNF